MSLHAFPKIFAIGSDYIADIFKEPVEITEKIDGSQFVFGKFNDQVMYRSKGKMIYDGAVDKMFEIAVSHVNEIDALGLLVNGVAYFCEYLQRPKHNVLGYESTPKRHLALFGMTIDGSFVKDHADLEVEANRLGIEVAPLIYSGKVASADMLLDMLDRESFLGGQQIEGVVVKNYDRPFLLGGQPIPLMAGKYVSEKFKERHQKDWKERSGKSKFELFKDSFRTEARWEKAVQHLRDNGDLENAPKDIGNIIKEIQRDIIEEHEEDIRNWLYKEYIGEILRYAIRGVPEWYKTKLLKRGFRNDEDTLRQ